MPQFATSPTDQAPVELSPAKLTAVDALLVGKSVTEVAASIGVNRTTVHRWQREPVFRALLNQRTAEIRASAESKLHALQSKALAVVESALDAGDTRVAMGLLRGIGLLDGRQRIIGSFDAEDLAAEQQRDDRERRFRRVLP
jgi:hypothetical protein